MDSVLVGARRAVGICAVVAIALFALQARAQPLPPLRVPNSAVGTRCFGLLPCTAIDPFGLRLRASVFAVFRPEKNHDRDFHAARLHIAPAVTLFQLAELGVVVPITLYKKEVGVAPIYEPLEPYGRLRVPLEALLGGIRTTAFARVRIASGPLVGGLPSPTVKDSPTDFVAQAIASYKQPTQFEAGFALQKRIGPLSATGSVATSVGKGRAEVYGGAELAYHFKIFQAFVQGQGLAIPSCPPDEAALDFCARAFRFAAGLRFDWDIGQGGLLIGSGSGAVEPGWLIGAQLGIDYDETTRRRHDDGIDAAHKWWQRRFDAMARGWAAWKTAAAAFGDDKEALRKIRPTRRSPFLPLLEGLAPAPRSPWLAALLDEESALGEPFTETFEASGPSTNKPPGAATPSRSLTRRNPKPSLYHQTLARAERLHRALYASHYELPQSLDLLTNADWDHLERQAEQERLAHQELQRRLSTPTPLPDWGLVALNTAVLAPFALTLTMLGGASPEAAEKIAATKRMLRRFNYSPDQEAIGTAMEDGLLTLFSVGAGEALAADLALARLALLRAAERGAVTAGERAAVQAAERAIVGVAEEGAELGGTRLSRLFEGARSRLNPMNYELRGLGSNFGNLRYRGVRPPQQGSALGAAERSEAAGASSATARSSKSARTIANEKALDDYFKSQGNLVEENLMEDVPGMGRQGDRFINGIKTEYKTADPGIDSSTIRNIVNDSLRGTGQARRIIIDSRNTGLSRQEAERGIRRVMGIARGKLDTLEIIGDDFHISN